MEADNKKTATRIKFQRENLEQLKQEQSNLVGENKKLQEEIERLDYYLGKSDLEELRQILTKKQEEKNRLEAARQRTQQEIDEKEAELRELTKHLDDQKTQRQNQVWRAEDEKMKAQEELQRLEKRRAQAEEEQQKAEEERKKFLREIQEAEEHQKRMSQWFEGIEAEKYREQLENTRKRCEILEDARVRMMQDLENMGEREEGDTVRLQQYFRDALRTLGERLEIYQNNYLAAMDGLRYIKILRS